MNINTKLWIFVALKGPNVQDPTIEYGSTHRREKLTSMVIPFGFDCEGKLDDAFRLSFLFLDGAGWGIAPTLANGMVTQGRKGKL